MIKVTEKEKIAFCDKICDSCFNRNFGSLSKADFEVFLFSEYYKMCINHGLKYDDYSLSQELGITQSRVRCLKEKMGLRYPNPDREYWKRDFVRALSSAKYAEQDNTIKMTIQDVNVMIEIQNYIEENGWYYDCSLNKKLLHIPFACILDICAGLEFCNQNLPNEAKSNIESIIETFNARKDSQKEESELFRKFLKEFSLSGLKQLVKDENKSTVFADVTKSVISSLISNGLLSCMANLLVN